MTGRILRVFILVVVLTGCVPATVVPTIVPTSIKTVTHTSEPPSTETGTATPSTSPTVEDVATFTISPTQTRSPTIPLPTLSLPTITSTAFPQPAAFSAVVQFYKPGPMSHVTSPVRFYGYAVPGYKNKGIIELFGEDGSLINSEVLQLNTAYKWAFFSWSLNFYARGAGELGRLSLSTSDQYGRITAIRSIPLFLMPEGPEILTPAEAMVERVVLEYPPSGKHISGGNVRVEGEMRSYNEQPLIMELIATDGAIVGSQLVGIPPGEGGEYFEFRVDIPYSVRAYTPVLLTIRQADDIIPGIMYLYSQEIKLSP